VHKTAIMWNCQMTTNLPPDRSQLDAIRLGMRVPRSDVAIAKRKGAARRDINVVGLEIGLRIPQPLLSTPEEFLDPKISAGTITLVALGPLVLISGMSRADVDELFLMHFRRGRAYSRGLDGGLQWPGGLTAISDSEFDDLRNLYRGSSPRIMARNERERPDMVIHDESRRYAKDKAKTERHDALRDPDFTPMGGPHEL